MKNAMRFRLIMTILISTFTFSFFATPVASASVECPVALHNLGCIASFDPGTGSGGGTGFAAMRVELNP